MRPNSAASPGVSLYSCFRLASFRIAGDDRNGALETLMEWVEEDFSKYRMDVPSGISAIR